MVNYQQGKIYKLINNESSEILYVGSTCDTLPKRLGGHKTKSKQYPNRKVYKNIMEKGGWDNVRIVLIEKWPCDERIDLLKRERYWIENCNSFNITTNIPSRSVEEYRNDYKEELRDKKRQYTLQNKEIIADRNKQYRQNNKDKIRDKKGDYYEKNKEIIADINKKYRQNNKEKIANKRKQYYQENKEKIYKKITCPRCSSIITKQNLPKHQKTKKCLNAV